MLVVRLQRSRPKTTTFSLSGLPRELSNQRKPQAGHALQTRMCIARCPEWPRLSLPGDESCEVSVKSQSWNKSSSQKCSDHQLLAPPLAADFESQPTIEERLERRQTRAAWKTKEDSIYLRIWNNPIGNDQNSHHGGENRRRNRIVGTLQSGHQRSLPVRRLLQSRRHIIQIPHTNKSPQAPTSISLSTARPNNPQTSPASLSPSGSASSTFATTSTTSTTCASKECARTSNCSA